MICTQYTLEVCIVKLFDDILKQTTCKKHMNTRVIVDLGLQLIALDNAL